MTEAEVTSDMSDYIAQGTNWRPVYLASFLHLVPPQEYEFTKAPSRTIVNAYGVDYPALVLSLRFLYTPNFNEYDVEVYAKALDWVKRNRRRYNRAIKSWNSRQKLPVEVLANIDTLTLVDSLRKPKETYSKRDLQKKVAQRPWTKDFLEDVRRVTFGKWERLRLHPYEDGKWIDPRMGSTSRTLKMITTFYQSGGEDGRFDVVDMLTLQLAREYLIEMKRRVVAL